MYVRPISALFFAGRSTPAIRAMVFFFPASYPCLCLCFGLGQMTRTTPSRLTILHLSHIFLTLARTFMMSPNSLQLPDDSGAAWVVRGQRHFHTVTRAHSYKIRFRGRGRMRQHQTFVGELHPDHRVGE